MRLTIRRRLHGSFALIALAALGIALSNYLQYRRLEGDAHAINLAGSQRMRPYRLAMLAAEHVAFPDPATERAIEADLARFRTVLATIGPPPTPEAAAALESGREVFESYEMSLRAIVRNANARARIVGGGREPELRAASEGLAATAADLAETMDRATNELERASTDAVRRYRRLQLALFAATAAIALVSFEGMRRHVLRRLPALEAGLHEVAHGHLGAEVHLGAAPDEVGRLEAAFNRMSHELEAARATILAHEAELVRADEMKSQFLATMSHELRTPLTSVIGFADHLRRGIYGPLTEEQGSRVDAILRNARSLLAMIGDLLDIAKIEAGKMEMRPRTVQVAALLDEVAEALRPLAEAKGLSLELTVAEWIPPIETDPERVRQILLNLGSNAVKFTEKGTVWLRAGPQPGGTVRIEVEDTGIGIAAASLPRLFGRFEQVDGSATRRHGGTGLGLHISKRIADLLGARIEVQSEPGRGSRFALVLPEPGGTRGGGCPPANEACSGRTSHADREPIEADPGGR